MKVLDGNVEEGFKSVSPLRSLGFISPPKKSVHRGGYFLRSCSKLTEDYNFTSGPGLGRGISGFCSDGHSLKENDQVHTSGALRVVLVPIVVPL